MKKTQGLEKQTLDKMNICKIMLGDTQKHLKKIKFKDIEDFNEWKKDFDVSIDTINITLDWILDKFEKELIYLPTV